MVSQRLGSDYEMLNKPCYVCGSFDHLQKDCSKRMVKPVWNNSQRVDHKNFSRMTHPNPKRNIVPRAVLMRKGLVPLTTARPINAGQPRPIMNSARPMSKAFNKAHSSGTWVNAARPKAVLKAVKGNLVNAVKALACWVWRPKQKVLDHVSKHNGASMTCKEFNYVDAQGRSKHMKGNISYLTDYEEIDGEFVAFGGNLKGGKIIGKDIECVVLSPDFKLTDKNHVLLKVPRKDNMYSVDLKNVVPQGGITCLFAKAITDESKLWHMRLGHVNFKSMNKLGIKREFSVARTPQQNGVAERKNRTLIEAARTMLADSKLPTTFWAEAVNTACRKYALSFMRPFGCPVTILNNIDHLGKFDGKADEVFFVGYSTNSKAFNGEEREKKDVGDPGNEIHDQEKEANVSSTNNTYTVSTPVNDASLKFINVDGSAWINADEYPDDLNMPNLEDVSNSDDYEKVGAEDDMNNLDTNVPISPIPTTRIHKDHLVDQIIGDIHSAPQTRRMTKNVTEHAMFKPKKVIQALKDPSWLEAMQEELLQFKLQKVWTL
ncbi:ribonuclease H-like domain-containing protein [Tanacetum coccineum]